MNNGVFTHFISFFFDGGWRWLRLPTKVDPRHRPERVESITCQTRRGTRPCADIMFSPPGPEWR
jgi:hypothetical protein